MNKKEVKNLADNELKGMTGSDSSPVHSTAAFPFARVRKTMALWEDVGIMHLYKHNIL